MKHKTLTWEIVKNKVDRPTGSPISKLVDYVMESELSKYLFPATMHTNLRIGRTDNFSREDGELTIEYEVNSDTIIFNYYDSLKTKPWSKKCESRELISTFNNIITKKLNWVKIDN